MLNTMFIPPRDPSQLVLHLVPGPRNRLNSTGTKQRVCFVSLSLTPPSESCTQPLPRTQRWVPRRANRVVLTTTQSYARVRQPLRQVRYQTGTNVLQAEPPGEQNHRLLQNVHPRGQTQLSVWPKLRAGAAARIPRPSTAG